MVVSPRDLVVCAVEFQSRLAIMIRFAGNVSYVLTYTQLSFIGYKPIRCEQKPRAFLDPQKNPVVKYLSWSFLSCY